MLIGTAALGRLVLGAFCLCALRRKKFGGEDSSYLAPTGVDQDSSDSNACNGHHDEQRRVDEGWEGEIDPENRVVYYAGPRGIGYVDHRVVSDRFVAWLDSHCLTIDSGAWGPCVEALGCAGP